MSFIADKIVMEGLTFDDLLLIPAYSKVLPRDVHLTSKFPGTFRSTFRWFRLLWIPLPKRLWL